MKFEITAEINGLNGKIETRLIGDYSITELKTLDKLLNYAIIKADGNEIRKKDNWVKGDRGLFAGSVPISGGKMSFKEFVRVSHQIATDFPSLAASEKCIPYENRNHFYIFSVQGFENYTFHMKIKIEGNEQLIKDIRKGLRDSDE